MAFLCQRQPYLRTLTANVLSCELVNHKGKELYRTLLDETIFFPEGGGQPWDMGTIDEVSVEYVSREKSLAVHYCSGPLKVGKAAACTIDWSRRFDHMQQHTAQHLLSAVLENSYGMKTTSWELGLEISNVELDSSSNSLTPQIKAEVEEILNEHIKNALSVTVKCLSLAEASDLIASMSKRGIPEDVAEPLRIIEIQGVDANMCCGTHVRHLGELHAIKLLHTSPMRGMNRLHFVAGGRILRLLDSCLTRETAITALLGNGPPQHVEIIENLKANQKLLEKDLKYAIRELAAQDAATLKQRLSPGQIIFHHRELSNTTYVNALFSSLGGLFQEGDPTCPALVVTCGGAKGSGAFSAVGPSALLQKLEPIALKHLDGKASVVKGRLQGKAGKIENYKKLQAELEKLKL